MYRWLRVLPSLLDDKSLFPGTYVKRFTTVYSSSSLASIGTCTHMHIHTHTHK